MRAGRKGKGLKGGEQGKGRGGRHSPYKNLPLHHWTHLLKKRSEHARAEVYNTQPSMVCLQQQHPSWCDAGLTRDSALLVQMIYH